MIPINTLLGAYRTGFFPMAVGGRVRWFSPDRRGILPLDAVHVSRRLGRLWRQGRFEISVNRAFDEVVRACASRPGDAGNWIDDGIIKSYAALHETGFAHSVEVWEGNELAGGLYGVSLKGAFFGESMFHEVTDASKIALVGLVERLRSAGYQLLDVQWVTPHLVTLGAVEVPRHRYLQLLADAMDIECVFDTRT
jgi:leucyl/phenylalanyl-tRNA--protein transferase